MKQLEFDWEKYQATRKTYYDESGTITEEDFLYALRSLGNAPVQPDTLVMSREAWTMMQNALAAPAPRRRRRRR